MKTTMACVTGRLSRERSALAATGSLALAAGAVVLALGIGHAWAHSGDEHEGGPQFGFGQPGHYDDVDRTVEIDAGEMFFEPTQIDVKPGETIRFVITNSGDIVHEFTLGTHDVQEAHQAEMMSMMNAGNFDPMFMSPMMEHTDWNAVMLNPGDRRVFIWQFDVPGTVEFGCNVPGHYESGMHGEIHVQQ